MHKPANDARLSAGPREPEPQGEETALTDGGGFADYRAQLDPDSISLPASRSLLKMGCLLKTYSFLFLFIIFLG